MPFFLDYTQAAGKFLQMPATPTPFAVVAANQNFRLVLSFRKVGATAIVLGSSDNDSVVRFETATTLNLRGSTTSSVNFDIDDNRTDFREVVIERTDGANVVFNVNGAQQQTRAFTQGLNFNRMFASNMGVSTGSVQLRFIRLFKDGTLAHSWENTTGTGTQMPDLVGSRPFNQSGTWPSDNSEWVFYESGTVTPITFTGTIPAQSATVGTPFSLNASSYFTGNQTPFTYAIQSGTLPAGLTLSGSTISGTPTTEGSATITVRATDAASNTATSNSFTITVAAAASVPQGTVTIGTVTAAQTTASVPFTYSLTDQTGFQYRLNGGAVVAAPSSPINLTGLTASTAYTIEVRATNGTGVGTWSAVTNFTTQAAPATAGFTLAGLVNNAGAPLANTSNVIVDVYNPSNGALVIRRTGLTTNGSGDVTVSDASLVAGTSYRVVISIGTALGVVAMVAS